MDTVPTANFLPRNPVLSVDDKGIPVRWIDPFVTIGRRGLNEHEGHWRRIAAYSCLSFYYHLLATPLQPR